MRDDVHLDIGTRVIDLRDGQLGSVAEPHYLARPKHEEICVHWDGSDPETTGCVPRGHVAYEGTDDFIGAMKRWHLEMKNPVS